MDQIEESEQEDEDELFANLLQDNQDAINSRENSELGFGSESFNKTLNLNDFS